MNRQEALATLKNRSTAQNPLDLLIIGGGATGLGCAVDAASRGHKIALIERADFAKGTSSRSTKLIHGGVRYLQQGNISLVLEALHERGLLCENAPHLVHHMEFVVPTYSWWEGPFYGIGLKIYDALAGRLGLHPSHILSKEETLKRIPTLETDGLLRGISYYDGQFDDARLAINLAQTISDLKAPAVNYVSAVAFLKDHNGIIIGITAEDHETGEKFDIYARGVINATGVFSDHLRQVDRPDSKPIITPSQGAHLILPREFLPGNTAIMVPHTSDGRVLFAVPWHDHVIVGTTDIPVEAPVEEPVAMEEEIDFILNNAARYLSKEPRREDILSVFAGLRPLVSSGEDNTATISRDHTILIAESGLITVTGGKWTTYRKMAEDTINQAQPIAGLESRTCNTAHLRIHGWCKNDAGTPITPLSVYGSDAPKVQALASEDPTLAEKLHPLLPYTAAEVVWAARHEMACTVEDVLARRTRALFLNARAALEASPKVAKLLAKEFQRDEAWETKEIRAFTKIASGYLMPEE